MDDRMLVWRRGWAREGRRGVELGCVLIKVLELVTGIVIEGILSKRCVSHVSQQHEALVVWAAEDKEQDGPRKSGLERAASCTDTWQTTRYASGDSLGATWC
jgi:hypothetical protein